MNHASDTQLVEVALVRLKGRSGATRIFTALSGAVPVNQTHAAFLNAFTDGRFGEALELLTALEASPIPELAKLYCHYRERLDAARTSPPMVWDGIYDPDRK